MADLRPVILRLYQEEKKVMEISRLLNISQPNVSRAIKRFEETGSNNDRAKSGRPVSANTEDNHTLAAPSPQPPSVNWTSDYNVELAQMAFDFAAAAYSDDPIPCLRKHAAVLELIDHISCDYVGDECWAYIARNDDFVVFSVRGTKTRLQLITELVETMSWPKKTFPAGGSVQRYFFSALKSVWDKGFGAKLRKLRIDHPKARFLFTGHSLGGALASLASSLFAYENKDLIGPDSIFLITYGQPRVGNMDYAEGHDLLVPNSWRIIHRYDLVAHLPYCYERLLSHKCASLYNHGPWHHGTEIWYPDGMNNTDSLFKICQGLPLNEDDSCSNGYYVHYGTTDHFRYFEKDVDQYGTAGCVDNKTSSSKRTNDTNQWKKSRNSTA
uniref:Fungal lipase-like domain-containing protein n=1 Tax=Ditylenchus dipsaci TaxID=166011 RepID=A0A915ECP1_9BILA